MQLGMVGLGRMGNALVRRLVRCGHSCVVYDVNADAVDRLRGAKVVEADTLSDLVSALSPPRIVWLMLPADRVDAAIDHLSGLLQQGDTLIDGGNSHYHDDIRRFGRLAEIGLHYIDVGTSGGIFGLERGFCLMVGGEQPVAARLDPLFAALSPAGVPSSDSSTAQPGQSAHSGYLYCGPAGAGHFVKMVHNAIEYGMMAAYAEGFNILRNANIGNEPLQAHPDATPLDYPEFYRYSFQLDQIAEVWRHGSVINSWLLDLAAAALHQDPSLTDFDGYVSDSGEGRWALKAALDQAVPAPVLSTALSMRFASRGNAEFANKVLSALRNQFGGHTEPPITKV